MSSQSSRRRAARRSRIVRSGPVMARVRGWAPSFLQEILRPPAFFFVPQRASAILRACLARSALVVLDHRCLARKVPSLERTSPEGSSSASVAAFFLFMPQACHACGKHVKQTQKGPPQPSAGPVRSVRRAGSRRPVSAPPRASPTTREVNDDACRAPVAGRPSSFRKPCARPLAGSGAARVGAHACSSPRSRKFRSSRRSRATSA